MEAFEPPKYITSLIAAVNDGAKSAQGGAFVFLLVGLYLLATAFSASDEDLLLGKTVTISQIGASLPVSFSFAIAPLVFVFLHIYALVRYDMLASNVRQFLEELRATVPLESDRERCRQLLINNEFVAVLAEPREATSYRWFWRWLFFGIVAVFPVAVLQLVQINALRYQSDLILAVQRIWLVLDLTAVCLFFCRNMNHVGRSKIGRIDRHIITPPGKDNIDRLIASLIDPGGKDNIDRLIATLVKRPLVQHWLIVQQRLMLRKRAKLVIMLPALIIFINFWWLETVPADADPGEVVFGFGPWFVQPLDALCPQLNWGCRFLRLDHRTLVDKVRDEKALAVLRMDISKLTDVLAAGATALGDNPDQKAIAERKALAERARSLAAIEGVFLPNRSLRFAVLEESPALRRQPERRRPDRRLPERRLPDRRPPERRRPDRRPPELRRPDRRPPELRRPDRRLPERGRPERRRPDRCHRVASAAGHGVRHTRATAVEPTLDRPSLPPLDVGAR